PDSVQPLFMGKFGIKSSCITPVAALRYNNLDLGNQMDPLLPVLSSVSSWMSLSSQWLISLELRVLPC
ncbi:MAG: hypothetical protein M3Y53_09055, partial [Thermoproteota archaeon]|nr:hypothetical protein [Thermoproteota archaeon]